jgi:hypothetical protein
VEPTTGRIHTSFNQTVTATGRLSSSDPNLQNIPTRTAEGQQIRAAFLPRESGWRFLAADYSQIELRILAHLSGDTAMRAAFAAGEDIHTSTAAAVFGIATQAVTSAMRRAAIRAKRPTRASVLPWLAGIERAGSRRTGGTGAAKGAGEAPEEDGKGFMPRAFGAAVVRAGRLGQARRCPGAGRGR